MKELILDSIFDTLKMVPFLLITFAAIEYFEHKAGKKFDNKIRKAGKYGPILGAFLGIIPQCGFSVMAVALFSEGVITLGTLLSIFIATSDEALPVLISTPGAINKVVPLIITKLVFAIFWGIIADLLIGARKRKSLNKNEDIEYFDDECINNRFNIKDITLHSLKRTIKISIYILIINIFIASIIEYIGLENLTSIMHKNSPFQVLIAGLIGLIPNCAISIGLVEVYLNKAINFSSLIAGLSANAGLALPLLFRESKNKSQFFYTVGLLLTFSFTTGLILYFLGF